jgi:hypothetical protein
MTPSAVCTGVCTNEAGNVNGDSNSVFADCLAFLAEQTPDLAVVVKAWPTLPAALKTGIVAMVKAATPSNEESS